VLIPELQVSCISKIWCKDIPEEFTKIPVLDEFVRTQSSTDNRLAFYRAALHLQVHYSGSRDRAALRQRSAQVILEQTRAIVADLFPLVSSLNTNSEDLGYLGLAHRDGAKDSSIRNDDLPDPQIVLRKRILQTMADTKPLLTTLETLLHRIEDVARRNIDHLWELSVDTQRWDCLYSAQTCAVARLAALLGDEIFLDGGSPITMEVDIVDGSDLRRPTLYREFLSSISSEDTDSDEM
jgi:hypothetical protein